MQVDGINSYVLSVRRAVQKLSKPIRCSEAPMKRKTDDCTALRSSASLISSAPHRHQTCRAEKFIAAHITDKPVPSATETKSGIGRAGPSLQRGFCQRLHPRFRSSPGTTDAIIPRTWETCGLLRRRLLRYASSLTPIPLRSIPVRP